MSDGPLERYRARVGDHALSFDSAQAACLEAFENLYRRVLAAGPLRGRKSGLMVSLFRPRPPTPPKGLYLYGDVGRGKSTLMDLFHQSLPPGFSHRIHFHLFMREAHATVHAWRGGTAAGDAGPHGDPIPALAVALTHEKRVLCLDEMDIQDIGDAMIVGRLFKAITDLGVVVVTTSNRRPDDLYRNGLQRAKFLPFIDLMKQTLTVIELAGPVDHRLDHLTGMTVYITPGGPAADQRLRAFMAALSPGETPAPDHLMVDGRVVSIPVATSTVAWFSFEQLCCTPLGSHDYLAIAERYAAVIVTDIPLLTPLYRDAARRFIVLVDALYENRAALLCSAAADPRHLAAEAGPFEFQRTVSRLLEMQTNDYLARARCEPCRTVPPPPDVSSP